MKYAVILLLTVLPLSAAASRTYQDQDQQQEQKQSNEAVAAFVNDTAASAIAPNLGVNCALVFAIQNKSCWDFEREDWPNTPKFWGRIATLEAEVERLKKANQHWHDRQPERDAQLKLQEDFEEAIDIISMTGVAPKFVEKHKQSEERG